MIRSSPMSSSRASRLRDVISYRAPNARRSTCSSLVASIGMNGDVTPAPSGIHSPPRSLYQDTHRTGASAQSSAAVIAAISSVFISPFRSDKAHRLKRRGPGRRRCASRHCRVPQHEHRGWISYIR